MITYILNLSSSGLAAYLGDLFHSLCLLQAIDSGWPSKRALFIASVLFLLLLLLLARFINQLRGMRKELNHLNGQLLDRHQTPQPVSSTEKSQKLRIFSNEQSFFSKVPSREPHFILQVNAVLEQHYSDPSFGPQQLRKALHLSRSQLYRKMAAATGKSVALYIRSYRLRKARQLIIGSQLNVSEAAYAVGFTNAAYFSKVYKQEFGYSPSASSGNILDKKH